MVRKIRWFRVYDDLVDDPKVQQLSGELFKAIVNLWCLTSQNDGALPPVAHIAFKLRMSPDKVGKLLAELTAAGLIDDTDGALHPHNWAERQFRSDTDPTAAERARRYRDAKRDAKRDDDTDDDRNVTTASRVTSHPPENRDRETDSDPDLPSLRSGSARAKFDEFWMRYPHKVGKADALKAFLRVAKSGSVTFDRLMEGLGAYVNKTDDRPWCNPSTWLNQGRWDDEPGQDQKNGKSILAAADRLLDKLGGVGAATSYVPGSSGPQPLRLDFGDGAPGVRLLPAG